MQLIGHKQNHNTINLIYDNDIKEFQKIKTGSEFEIKIKRKRNLKHHKKFFLKYKNIRIIHILDIIIHKMYLQKKLIEIVIVTKTKINNKIINKLFQLIKILKKHLLSFIG